MAQLDLLQAELNDCDEALAAARAHVEALLGLASTHVYECGPWARDDEVAILDEARSWLEETELPLDDLDTAGRGAPEEG